MSIAFKPPPCFEMLESRQLLSAVLDQDVLRVESTRGDDKIRIIRLVSETSLQYIVRVNGKTQGTFDAARVQKIDVDAGAGNDFVELYDRAATTKPRYAPATVLGRDGNDSILGASGHDLLKGGAGNDTLRGLDGNDTLVGGDGDDELGSSQFTALLHEHGNDLLVGGKDQNALYAGNGDDTLLGGSGVDFLWPGAGIDSVMGAGGRDEVVTGDAEFSDFDPEEDFDLS